MKPIRAVGSSIFAFYETFCRIKVQVILLHYSTYKEHSMKRGCPIQEGIMWEGFTVVVTLGLQKAMEGRLHLYIYIRT